MTYGWTVTCDRCDCNGDAPDRLTHAEAIDLLQNSGWRFTLLDSTDDPERTALCHHCAPNTYEAKSAGQVPTP
jgi:hypothetical protein